MKKLLFLLTLLVCVSCAEDTSIDPTLMPEATSEGQNTFGCLIDGWVYTSGRFGLPQATAYMDESGYRVVITAPVDLFRTLSLTLFNPVVHSECDYTGSDSMGVGKAFITRNDGKVISGTFRGEGVTEGRFDVRFTDADEEGGATIAFLSQRDGLSFAEASSFFRETAVDID